MISPSMAAIGGGASFARGVGGALPQLAVSTGTPSNAAPRASAIEADRGLMTPRACKGRATPRPMPRVATPLFRVPSGRFMSVHALAGKPAPKEILIDVARVVDAYYDVRPDTSNPEKLVSFGTSGHRGSPEDGSFNEAH